MNVKVNLEPAANRFNTNPENIGAKKSKTAFLNAGDSTSEIAVDNRDSFTQRLAESFKNDNSELIRGLDQLSDSEKAELVMNSYLQMQGRLMSAVKNEEDDIKAFTALKNEKDYYNGLLNEAKENGTAKIENGKYGFADLADGTDVTERSIDKQLEDVQERIDKFIYPYGRDENGNAINGPGNDSALANYRKYADIFEEITGLTGDCLNPGDELLRHKLDRDENNFLQKANESITTLKKFSNQLNNMKKEFFGESEIEIGGGKLSEEDRTRMEAFEFVRDNFINGGNSDGIEQIMYLDTKA